MTVTAQMIGVALLALVTGIAVPLMVQLFLTLRSLQRVAGVLDRRLDRTLGELSEVASNLRQSTSPGAGSSALLAALAPALVAAVGSFASSMTTRRSDDRGGDDSPGTGEEVRS
jgi:hypothetical protein